MNIRLIVALLCLSASAAVQLLVDTAADKAIAWTVLGVVMLAMILFPRGGD